MVQNLLFSFIYRTHFEKKVSRAFDGLRYIQYDIYLASPFLILASAALLCAVFAAGPFYFPCAVVDQTQ